MNALKHCSKKGVFKMKMSNQTYDTLKWFVQIFLPAFITFSGVVGQVLGWEQTELFLTLVGAFTVFLGSLLGISNSNYKKGND